MAQFSPDDSQYDGNAGNVFERLERPGRYLLAIDHLIDRGTTTTGKPKINFGFVVIGRCEGPSVTSEHAGQSFRDSVFVTPKALWRFAMMCRAMGWHEPFDPDDDREVKRAVLGRPFVADVSIEEANGRRYARLGDVVIEPSQAQRDAGAQWRADWEATVQVDGAQDDSWARDDAREGASAISRSNDDADWPTDGDLF